MFWLRNKKNYNTLSFSTTKYVKHKKIKVKIKCALNKTLLLRELEQINPNKLLKGENCTVTFF